MRLLIILFSAIFIIFVINNLRERFGIIEGLNTFNGKSAIDDQDLYDKLFENVIYYPNEYKKNENTLEEIGKLINTGWIKCLSKCDGYCIEYGITGNSYCFSKEKTTEENKKRLNKESLKKNN
jgi:hypothetical protein